MLPPGGTGGVLVVAKPKKRKCLSESRYEVGWGAARESGLPPSGNRGALASGETMQGSVEPFGTRVVPSY